LLNSWDTRCGRLHPHYSKTTQKQEAAMSILESRLSRYGGIEDSAQPRSASAFRSRQEGRRYWVLLSLLLGVGLLASLGLLLYNNPVPVDSPSFIPIVERRLT